MDIFAHNFMIKAMIIGVILSIIIPAIGIVVVNKRISIIGDALSHTSLAGVVIGLFCRHYSNCGFNYRLYSRLFVH